jgi:predicted TIM-barrel fold metal-dependent hydrolase
MGNFARTVSHTALVITLCSCAFAQHVQRLSGSSATALHSDTDPALAGFIASIKAIDNHAHPVLPPPAIATDREFDALPVDSMEPQTDAVALRSDNPQLNAAWKALWNFTGKLPLDAVALKQLQTARAAVRASKGAAYDNWVLDRAGIGTALANRVRMGQGIAPPRFQWVPYDDALLFPLNNSAMAASSPDKAMFFPLEAKVLTLYLHDASLQTLPATLDEYLAKLVLPTLRAQQRGGAVAIKFEVAYLRGFDFTAPSHEEAARVYAASVGKGAPDAAAYKLLQDFLFRTIAAEAGRLGMAVHLHTMAGAGSYFGIADANPMLLEPVFNDHVLRKNTNFVMLHGGWPFVHEAGALLQKPNVYLDLSQQAIMFPPRTLSTWLREWLELYPEKVLYATDGYPYSDALGWEESLWIADANVRAALGLALTGMMRDGEIDRARAQQIATMVLRGNAAALYHLDANGARLQ